MTPGLGTNSELTASPARAMWPDPPPAQIKGQARGECHAKDRPGALPQAGGMRLMVSRWDGRTCTAGG